MKIEASKTFITFDIDVGKLDHYPKMVVHFVAQNGEITAVSLDTNEKRSEVETAQIVIETTLVHKIFTQIGERIFEMESLRDLSSKKTYTIHLPIEHLRKKEIDLKCFSKLEERYFDLLLHWTNPAHAEGRAQLGAIHDQLSALEEAL